MEKIAHLLQTACLILIRGYQWMIAPFFNGCCGFTPSCSEYAKQAILTHGTMKGLYLTLLRLLRCHPWAARGEDFVPPRRRNEHDGT